MTRETKTPLTTDVYPDERLTMDDLSWRNACTNLQEVIDKDLHCRFFLYVKVSS